MKRIAVVLAGALTLMLGVAPVHAQKKVVGLALASDTNPFYIVMRAGVEARAKELGWEVRVVTANEDVSRQVNGVMDLVAQKVDGILISPIDAVATGAAYEAAHKAKIPIISLARGAKSPYQSLFVAMDSVQIGRDIAGWAAGAAGGKGKVGMIAGPAGANVFEDLAAGFKSEIAKHKDMPIVFQHQVALTREQGLKQAEDLLVAHPDVRVIYAGNDELALGAAQAVAAAGKKSSILITGLNGIPPALAAVTKGEIDLTIVLSPMVWGRMGMDVMDGWLKGNRPKDQVFIKHILATKENAADYMPPKK
ncbi:MAG: substrate-binding domain-containing protein [Burkholderiaceae bacterium]|nr:substrate-binding domain-containing protein [Burkholderiaceae bacterium]